MIYGICTFAVFFSVSNKLDVGFKQAGGCRISDFCTPDVGFLQVGCRILKSRMSDFYKSDVECRIFKVGCRMAPISFRRGVSDDILGKFSCNVL